MACGGQASCGGLWRAEYLSERVDTSGTKPLLSPGPLFVVQWLFDQAQLIVDNAYLTGQPVQEDQRLYVQNLAGELRHTLQNVS